MGHGVRYLCPMPETAMRRFLPPLQGVGFLAVFFDDSLAAIALRSVLEYFGYSVAMFKLYQK